MKYIRTKDGVYKVVLVSPLGFVRIDKRDGTFPDVFEKDIIKQADTIEKLVDRYVIFHSNNYSYIKVSLSDAVKKKEWLKKLGYDNEIYGAIWTDKGLIYVAKMNEKGELELL